MSTQLGTKPSVRKQNFRSAEASANIPVGAPVVFKMDGTEDLFRAVLPSSASAILARQFFAGINVSGQPVAPNGYGTAQCWGLVPSAIVVNQTRANSSASWSTAAALSAGQALTVDTVFDALVPIGTGALSFVTGASLTDSAAYQLGTLFANQVVLAQSAASAAGSASSSNDTRVKITTALKVYLRLM